MQHEECSSRFYDTKIANFPLNLTSVNSSIARAHSVSSLTFVEARAVVDLGLQRLVRVPGGRAHLPGCLEHDVVPAHRGALLTILSGCLKVNRTYSIEVKLQRFADCKHDILMFSPSYGN